MEKKGLLVLLLAGLCLLTVACGKDKKEDKKEEKNTIQTLKCSAEEDGEKLDMEITVDTKEHKVTKGTMVMTVGTELYKSVFKTDKELEEGICKMDEDAHYKKCEAKVTGKTVTVDIEFDPEAYTKELQEEEGIKELDEDAMKTMKSNAEKSGYTCTLS